MDTSTLPWSEYGQDQGHSPVSGRSADHAADGEIPPHSHPTAQLIHAVQGVMVVRADDGQWIVPPTRGLWMPPGVVHQMRLIGEVRLRTVYIRPDASPDLPQRCQVVRISPLLRELILAAIEIEQPYAADSRDGRLMRLLLDEVAALPSLPLRLPAPVDPALQTICRTIADTPDDPSTLADWAGQLGVNARTIQRRFLRETGMTFGDWRQQARLIMALERLASGEKVIDVALSLGYNSPSAFATMFKQQFGVTPSGYFRTER
ncbi:AraC family transcriptional regulator [Propionivibrio limicola]|uniref:AraC family transcriptional regulator n=1 Tax=Propionivibrio limicola TaxID=167645 RepID=UPI00129264E2|nr:helix-turn-helix transcriptional regulator [Propionivibrio limicola]